jgi:alanine-synthesizing transaminase
MPDLEALEALITPRTRALVIINPNNPTGAVYPRATLERMIALAERHGLIVYSDEIYDGLCFDAPFVPAASLVRATLCVTMSGLSKVWRACGLRVGWMSLSGHVRAAREYLKALDLLSALRLCSNMPGQWTIEVALGLEAPALALTAPGGRLFETRKALLAGISNSEFLSTPAPEGAIYAFPGVDLERLPSFDDQRFAMDLLERKRILVVPGSSFNVSYRNHFRITLLPEAGLMRQVLNDMEALLCQYAESKDLAVAS